MATRRRWPASPARHPLKALDDKAMDLASRDASSRPRCSASSTSCPACRNLDDLAPPPDRLPRRGRRAARRRSPSRCGWATRSAGRAALGRRRRRRRQAHGAPLHRRRVPQGGHGRAARAVEGRRRVARSTCSARRRSPRPRPSATPQRCAEALETLAAARGDWPERAARWSATRHGPLPRANLSVKVSALTPLLRARRARARQARRRRAPARAAAPRARPRRPPAHRHGVAGLARRGARARARAARRGRVPRRPVRRHGAAGLPARLARVARHASSRGRASAGARAHPLTVRLVKGAYWDHEIVEARQHGWDVAGVRRQGRLRPQLRAAHPPADRRPRAGASASAIASHNLRSVAHAIAYNRLAGGEDRDVELQVLRGLGDPLQEAIAAQGLRVRTYCPVGDLVAGMAYLVRRLLENTSNDSFLPSRRRASRSRSCWRRPMSVLDSAPARRQGRRRHRRATAASAVAARRARCSEAGARVAIAGPRRAAARTRSTPSAAGLGRRGRRHRRGAVGEMVETRDGELGPIDVIVNNAGGLLRTGQRSRSRARRSRPSSTST